MEMRWNARRTVNDTAGEIDSGWNMNLTFDTHPIMFYIKIKTLCRHSAFRTARRYMPENCEKVMARLWHKQHTREPLKLTYHIWG